MGMSGLTIAWEKAHSLFDLKSDPDGPLAMFTAGLFVLLLVIYTTKVVRYRPAVVAELRHPIKLNFFPTISISLLLLSVVMLHRYHDLAQVLWFAGAALHIFFTFYVMNVWIYHEHFEVQHLNPSWLIPVVGNVVVPITGVSLGYYEISWFFFSIGIVFWLVLLAIIFNRVLFHNPLPNKLMPTLFILIAPPAIGFISYIKLTGSVDAFAHVLYYAGLFLTILLLTQARRFARLQFFISWWAYTFPMAAITVATMVMYEKSGLPGFMILSWALLFLLTCIVFFMLYKTAKAVSRGDICLPE
jgi:tellurite resistance protein